MPDPLLGPRGKNVATGRVLQPALCSTPLLISIPSIATTTMRAARNIYKHDVDFEVLALQSPDFAKLCVDGQLR